MCGISYWISSIALGRISMATRMTRLVRLSLRVLLLCRPAPSQGRRCWILSLSGNEQRMEQLRTRTRNHPSLSSFDSSTTRSLLRQSASALRIRTTRLNFAHQKYPQHFPLPSRLLSTAAPSPFTASFAFPLPQSPKHPFLHRTVKIRELTYSEPVRARSSSEYVVTEGGVLHRLISQQSAFW